MTAIWNLEKILKKKKFPISLFTAPGKLVTFEQDNRADT